MPTEAIFSEFEQIEKSLPHIDPAEAHGMLCGMLSINDQLAGDSWIQQIMSETTEVNLAAERLLRALFSATLRQLHDQSMGFYLLLPSDDSTSLTQRAASLGRWCQGYLSGLGLGGMQADIELPTEVKEFLDDMLKIAQVGFFDTEGAGEDDEAAYTEIVEYVKVGVLLVHVSLHPSGMPHSTRLH